ncbi:hypothetical protein D9756_008315 [Leucocoprinus leucothites]|uniref:WW domain-containing protein n=1 Tax=Leucocoprinus leucothites TaxID=201217 RepID=A0A8H5D007_9AGAR|nr:hypothetical protein D9756_008315 [Leucoagaricus leucothites]
MAEEENEVLDWGNEDDIVSLGDEDERYTLEDPASTSQNGPTGTSSGLDAPAAPLRSNSLPPAEGDSRAKTPDHRPATSTPEPSKPSPTLANQTSHTLPIPTRLTHALPPKPVTANIPYVPPSDPTIVEATAMASRPNKKVDTSGRELKDGSRSDHIGPLPPQWEIRFSRDRPNEFYYYDLRYKVSTWDRPSAIDSSAPEAPVPLSHDDRHYRPDGRHAPSTGRRYEGNGDPSDNRQGRHPSGNAGRSPQRGRDHSRSLSPQARDSRSRNNQRSARGRGNKSNNGFQKGTAAPDTSKNDDRHWVPSPPSSGPQHLSRSMRRQLNRAQNQSKEERAGGSRPEDAEGAPPQREAGGNGPNHDKDHTYSPEYPSNNSVTTIRIAGFALPAVGHNVGAFDPALILPGSITPPRLPQDEPLIIYQTKVEPRREREASLERPRSPGPIFDPSPPAQSAQNRRDRPTRFGAPVEKANGLPAKPATAPVDRSAEFSRSKDWRSERRMEPERYSGGAVPQYSPPANRSPLQTRLPELSSVPPSNGDGDRRSPVRTEILGPPTARKRQPLPPQDREFREAGRVKPPHIESSQRTRDPPLSRSDSFNFQDREKVEVVADVPPPAHEPNRSYSGREDLRDVGYNQPPLAPRDAAPEYERGYERDRPRGRQRMNDQADQDRSYGLPVDVPPTANDGRTGYQERERDPPSKPRAMQQDSMSTLPGYAPVGPSNPVPLHQNRYRDRPSPPHFSMPDSRVDPDARSGPPPLAWQEKREDRREERPYAPPDRPAARVSRGRPAMASSANSIPIGTRRTYSGFDSSTTSSSATNDRFERPSYPPNDSLRQARNYDQDHPRSYQEEPVSEERSGYPKPPREVSYSQVPLDDRPRRIDKAEHLPRNPASLPAQPAATARQQRQNRYTGPRNPRVDQEQPLDPPPQQKAWPAEYDTSPRGRYDSAREATPPPISRDSSFTSPNWDPPSPNFHEPLPRAMDYPEAPGYRKPSPQIPRIEVELAPARQASGPSVLRNASTQPVQERYQRQDAGFAGLPRPPQPLPRANHRRDPSSYSPEARRAPPVQHVQSDVMERGSGRSKWGDMAATPMDETMHDERPRLLNERISEPPPPSRGEMQGRGARKQPQGIRQNNGYNGELVPPEVRAMGRMDIRQDNYPPPPVKTFEQRLDPIDRQQVARTGTLLSRISHGGNDVPPPSLRDRVQTGNKRDRDDMVRGHFPDAPMEVDDGDPDAGGRRRKRRRARRGGAP